MSGSRHSVTEVTRHLEQGKFGEEEVAGSSVDTTASLLTSRAGDKVSTNVPANIKYSLDPDAPKGNANVHAEIVVALQ